MPVSKRDKARIIDSLLDTNRKAHRLEITLLFAGENEAAEKVRAESEHLSAQIDELLAQVMRTWTGNGATIVEEQRKNNAALQRSITQISKSLEKAEKVANAIGYIDDAVKRVTSLLA